MTQLEEWLNESPCPVCHHHHLFKDVCAVNTGVGTRCKCKCNEVQKDTNK